MPMICFPCLPASTRAHFDEEQEEGVKAKGINEEPGGLEKPTSAEYAGEAAKEFLRVLEDIASEIPIPGVSAAVTVAINLIAVCEDSQATLEKAEGLKLRIKTLVTVVINELKEKKSNETREKLKDDIDALQRELKYIEKKLDEIASQHALLLVFFRSINEEKVQSCMDRLDGLLERFSIARQIDHANLLDHLEKEITRFYAEQKHALDYIRKVVEDTNVTMEHVAAIMRSAPTAGSSSSPSARAPIPPSSNLFYGRDKVVSDLATLLASTSSSQERHHVAILGPGGMGKTSTALAVMAHPSVRELYSDNHCVWVPCVKATSVPFFLETLCLSLGIEQMTGNVINNILSVLKSSGPIILLLDNFETLWNVGGGVSETERILCKINQIPHVTMFVTMRSSDPPCKGLQWHSVNLKAVDADAAMHIYSQIHSDGSTDPQLPALLELVGNMPLAVTLMATTASQVGLSAKDLLEQYIAIGPTFLSGGFDPEHSMNMCLSLSVDSPIMKRSPEAQWLLGALAMLPVGATFSMLSNWWAGHLSNPAGALQVLRQTSLVEKEGSTFSLLPVIQRYVLDPIRFDPRIRDSMLLSACKYLSEHRSSLGDKFYEVHAKELAAEESNLEAVLFQAVAPCTEVINALLTLARYQAPVRPRTNAIQRALELVLQVKGESSLHVTILACYGDICYNLDRFDEAERHFSGARQLFLGLSNVKEAAECLLRVVDIFRLMGPKLPSELASFVSQAQSEFESIAYPFGVAQCWFYHGMLASASHNFDSSLDLLRRAYDKFTEYKDPLFIARCSDEISRATYWTGDLERAEEWAQSTKEQLDLLGPSRRNAGAGINHGRILNANGKYAAALQVFVQCLEYSKNSGASLGIALALQEMGVSWMKMGKKEDAQGALREALGVFPLINDRMDHVLCRYLLKKMDEQDVIPTSSERKALEWGYPAKVQRLLGL